MGWSAYIMQSLPEKSSKNKPFFPSQEGTLQSAILCILSTAAVIIVQTKSDEISAMLVHPAVELNFTRLF